MQNSLPQKRDKKIWIFGSASLLNDLGSDMISPIWPLLVTDILKAPMSVLGFLDGLGETVVAFSQAGAGFLSDKIKKRKIFIWLGYLLPFIARIGYSVSTLWQYLIPFKIADRLGKMRDAPRDAILAESVQHEKRGLSFGILEALDSLGAVLGIIICLILIHFLDIRKIIFLAAFPSFISILLILFFIQEVDDKKIYQDPKLPKISKNLKLFFIASSIFALSTFSYSFLLLFATKFGFSHTFVPILYLILTTCTSLFAWPFGKLADKIGRKITTIFSFVLWGLTALIFIISQNYWIIIFCFILFGLHKAAWKPIQKTFVSELAPAKAQASALGSLQMILGLCAFPSSFIAGLLWDFFGPRAPFYFALGLVILATAIMSFVKEPEYK